MNFTKFLRTPFPQNPSGRLLLSIIENEVSKFENSVLEFVSVIGMISIFGNSAVNAILFLMSNVKEKRVWGNIKMW